MCKVKIEWYWWTPPEEDTRLNIRFYNWPWAGCSLVVRLRRRWLILRAERST